MSAWDDWFTPAYIFDAMGVVFDLDVASPPSGPRHVPCRGWLSENALSLPWSGFVWMNAPFGGRNGLFPWLKKFIAHANGVALTPNRTAAPWFQQCAAGMDLLLFVSPKVQFERPDGSLGKSPGHGTVLMAIGDQGQRALCRAGILGLAVKVAG